MTTLTVASSSQLAGVVPADHEVALFKPGDPVRVFTRQPIGHYRVPTYLRGKLATVEAVIEPCGVNNEEEGFGRNAGARRHYYRISVPMSELWPSYTGSLRDGLYIEVFETWLERA